MKIESHSDLDIPHGNTVIWRYMGLDKFLDFLTHRRLFFTNADNFTDGYEVSLPTNLIKKKRKQLISEGLRDRDLQEEIANFKFAYQPMGKKPGQRALIAYISGNSSLTQNIYRGALLCVFFKHWLI